MEKFKLNCFLLKKNYKYKTRELHTYHFSLIDLN